MVQWLGLRASTVVGPGSMPGQVTKMLQAAGAWPVTLETDMSEGGNTEILK